MFFSVPSPNSTQFSAVVIDMWVTVTPLEVQGPFHRGHISAILNIRYLHRDVSSGKMTVMEYVNKNNFIVGGHHTRGS